MFLNFKKRFTLKHKDNPSLMDVFKPLYIILCFLGLFPFTVKYPTPDEPSVEVKSIIPNAICASLMTLVLCILITLNSIYYINVTQQMVDVININYFIGIAIVNFGVITTYISTFKNRKVYIKILNDVSTTWTDLGLADVKDIIKYFKFHVRVMILGWLSIEINKCITTFIMQRITEYLLTETAYSLWPEVLFISIVGFFYVLILMVACLLKNIDQHVRNLHQSEREDILNTLSRLALAYVKAIEVKREINRIFELIIAVLLIDSFFATLRQVHGVYHALYLVKQKLYEIMWGISFILYPLSKLFAISYTGSMLKNMAMKIGQSLHAIPINEDDTKLFMAIQHFSKLMYYYETELTIFGFFSLDSNLLFNMVASVVTYFVVLVQFDL